MPFAELLLLLIVLSLQWLSYSGVVHTGSCVHDGPGLHISDPQISDPGYHLSPSPFPFLCSGVWMRIPAR